MSNKKHLGLKRRNSGLMALEQRFMFDGAAVGDLVTEASKTVLDSAIKEATDAQPLVLEAPALFQTQVSAPVLQAAIVTAQQSVRDFINQADDQTLFSLFNGGQTAPDADWSQRLAELRAAINDGSFNVAVMEMDSASVATSIAAYTHAGPDGKPTVFINRFWFDLFEGTDATKALVEEFGHAVDDYLNPNADTAGDEGEAFAAVVAGSQLGADERAGLSTQNDYGSVIVNGVSYEVEFASFSFTNAYEMVYDLNNSSNTEGVTTDAIDTNERWADKEQNLHYFNASDALQVTTVNDGTSVRDFSGNDVSGAVAVTIGSTTYYGWISRPIKVGGVVKGFYFWTDSDFTTLALAQADGNQDADRSVLDNRGFVLVVNQAHFDSLTATTYAINNAKDGNLGSVSVKSIGSSSDRVDAAMNSVLAPNAVTAVADVLSVTEDSGSSTGNLLSNDSDPNGDSFTLSGYMIAGISGSQTLGGNVTIAGVGTINISSTGAYTFTPAANFTGPVPVITYTITDAFGATSTATFSIEVTAVNDPPVANPDTKTVAENTPVTGNLISNDTDPDGNSLTVTSFTYNDGTQAVAGTLGSNNTITLNGTTVGVLKLSANGTYIFTPAADYSGAVPVIDYTISDGQGGSASSTLTLTMSAVNSAPTAASQTGTAVEEGCGVTTNAANNATGSLLAGATDPDGSAATAALTVVKVTSETNGTSTNSSGGTEVSVQGLYGTLYFLADGTYRYEVDNTNPTVNALNSGGTLEAGYASALTERFTYRITDTDGLTSDSTLTVTINGTNDDPVALDDYSSLKESALSGGNYGTVDGNALDNDKDVDNSNTTLDVAGSYASAIGSAAGTITYDLTSSSSIGVGDYVFYDDDGSTTTSAVVAANTATAGEAVRLTVNYNGASYDMVVAAKGAATSLKIVVGGVDVSVSLNQNEQGIVFANGDFVGFSSNADASGNYKVSKINSSAAPSSTTVNISSLSSGVISAGMSVTNGTDTRTVSSINTDSNGNVTSIVLDTAVTWSDASLTFSDTASPLVLEGTYGSISINTVTGAYTYTLTSDALADGAQYTEKFAYRVTDGSCTDDAIINITLTGSAAPTLTSDSLVVSEDSGNHVSFNGASSSVTDGTVSGLSSGGNTTDNLFTNDANGSNGVTLGNVTNFYVDGGAAVAADTSTNITGVGSLTIHANGTVVFDPIDNYTGPVPTIKYDRLGSDNVSYSAYLTITVTPSNDPPDAVNDTGIVVEDTAKSGNLLYNDTDPENDTLTVTAFTYNDGASLVNGTMGSGNTITLNGVTVGALTISSTGGYTFTPAANYSGNIPVFTYTVSDGNGGTDTATLTLTMAPVNDPPVNSVPAAQTLNSSPATSYSRDLAFSSGSGINLSVADADSDIRTIVLHVSHGVLALDNTGYGAVTITDSGTSTVSLSVASNNQTALNEVLKETLHNSPFCVLDVRPV